MAQQIWIINMETSIGTYFGTTKTMVSYLNPVTCRSGTTMAYSWGNALNGDRAKCDSNYQCGTTVKGRYRKEADPVSYHK